MIPSGDVSIRTASGVATIEFGHPKSNSLPGALLQRIAESIDAVAADAAARVVVLRSTEPGPFCAGASFDELKRIDAPAAGKAFFLGFAHVILAMRRCPKLVIARVHGKAVGGGVGVIAAADYAVATQNAAVKLSELAIGIGPFVVGPVIERKIGPSAFQALAIDAASWRDSAWAERHGLFAQVTADVAALDATVDGLAKRLSESNPDAMARLKQVFWQGTDHWATLLDQRAAMSGELVVSEFTRAALA